MEGKANHDPNLGTPPGGADSLVRPNEDRAESGLAAIRHYGQQPGMDVPFGSGAAFQHFLFQNPPPDSKIDTAAKKLFKRTY